MTTDEKIRFVAIKACGAVVVNVEDWQEQIAVGVVYIHNGHAWVRREGTDNDTPFNPCSSLDDCAIAEKCIVRDAHEYRYYLALLAIVEKDSGKKMPLSKKITATPMQRVDAMIRAHGGKP